MDGSERNAGGEFGTERDLQAVRSGEGANPETPNNARNEPFAHGAESGTAGIGNPPSYPNGKGSAPSPNAGVQFPSAPIPLASEVSGGSKSVPQMEPVTPIVGNSVGTGLGSNPIGGITVVHGNGDLSTASYGSNAVAKSEVSTPPSPPNDTRRRYRILELCSGFGGWSQPWLEAGHTVTRIDFNPKFADVPFTIVGDVRKWHPDGPYDFVFASPPCEAFSRARFINPKSKAYDRPADLANQARALLIVEGCERIIMEAKPTHWVVENPKAELRNYSVPPTTTVYYCEYGETWKKPTDLWSDDEKIRSLSIPCSHKSHALLNERFSLSRFSGSAARAVIPRKLADSFMALWAPDAAPSTALKEG